MDEEIVVCAVCGVEVSFDEAINEGWGEDALREYCPLHREPGDFPISF